MERLARQLETVRFTARWLLVGQRLFQWAAALIGVAVALGLLDYALRLPDWLRLVLGLAAVVLAGVWIVGRLRAAWAFRPGLDELALRLERMYPQLSGQLATAVDFTTHAELYRAPERTASLVSATLAAVRDRLPGVEVRRLLDPSRTVRTLLALALAGLALAVIVAAAPHHSRIAAERWLAPLGDAEWPRRTEVAVLDAPRVWPADTPIRLAAGVERGYEPGMRVTVDYRLTVEAGEPGRWQSLLMTEQSLGDGDTRRLFERQIELPEPVIRQLEETGGAARLEFAIRAGDDQTQRQTLALVPRPAVTGLVATITPPAYAAGFVEPQTAALHEQSGQVASVAALQGSTVVLRIGLNKPNVTIEPIPGLPTPVAAEAETTAREIRFQLTQGFETPIRLMDEHGLTNLSERRYRIEAIEDKPPTVSLVRPAADEAVLATATVPVQALAQDDVAVERVRLEATHEQAPRGGQAAQRHEMVLTSLEARSVDARADHELDLAQWSTPLAPGDAIVLHGVAEDVFDLDGRRHEPVQSSPRRLRIIEGATLIGQLRDELAAVRQQAVRMEQGQRRVAEEPSSAEAAPEQAELSRRMDGQSRRVDDLRSRAERNRLDEPVLRETIDRADALLDQAREASARAQRTLEAATERDEAEQAELREQATADQQAAAEALAELVALLDQGRDAFALELTLRQMQAQQSDLAEAARRLFPQTVGQDPASLPQELREALRDLAEQQRAMSEQADDLVRQMQETAQDLARENEDRARAAAEALAEAAATAQRQNLEGSMQQASESIGENQLSQAAQEQAQSQDTLQQMLDQMGTQQDRMWAMLRRRLQQMAEAIRELIERQERELAALDAEVEDARLPTLEPGEAALRRSTMATEEQARASEELQPVGDRLGEAVTAQGDAVLALREAERLPAKRGENDALAALQASLEQVRALEQETAEEQARQERQELKQAYQALAERQAALRDRTGPYAERTPLDRKARSEVVDLGHEQSDVQASAAELREQVSETLVFQAMHDRLDQAAARATRQLRAGQPGDDVLDDQQQVAGLLRTMAAALDEEREPEPFAGQQGAQQGGGGGGGAAAKVIPPVAELKLLRGLQESIYVQTRSLDQAPPGDAGRDRLLDLSTRQRELSALGERLIESLQNPMGEPAEGDE